MLTRFAFAALVVANTAASRAQDVQSGDFSLTVYSTADPATFDPQQLARQQLQNPYARWQYQLPGYGVVREIRKIDLVKGDNTLKFTDVASGIDPTSVSFLSLTDPATSVLEQNYEYDLVSGEKLLEKYVGSEIKLARRANGGEGAGSPIEGTLLSADYQSIVLQTTGGVQIIGRGEVSNITLAKQSADLITKPTLVWKLNANRAGKHDAQVTYQTDGLTWRADYNVILNEHDTAADVGAWVTLLNQSGASYPNAKLKLVAGDVQRVKPSDNQYGMAQRQMADMSAKGGSGGFQEKTFFEYHLYTLGRATSIGNNSTKQIELFESRSNVPVTKTFVYYGLSEQFRYWFTPNPAMDQNLGIESNKKVDIYVLMDNAEKNGMGIPLPAGRVRVYKRDTTDGNLEFIGEDVIQHTPKNEKVMTRLGTAFDIVGERRQTDFKCDYNARWITESFEIKLRNHKKEPVKIIVKENLYRWTNWEITDSSTKWEKQDFRTIHMPVEVAPDGEKVVTYHVRYTW